MPLDWMNIDDTPFQVMLLLEDFQIDYLTQSNDHTEALFIALKANRDVEWVFRRKSPLFDAWFDAVEQELSGLKPSLSIRDAEKQLLRTFNDWIVYVCDPKIYDNLSLTKWDKKELLDITDFHNKRVIDIGPGTGIQTFPAAEVARVVYTVEPVKTLRDYLRKKAKTRGFTNIHVTEGLMAQLPFENDFADIVMSGHVFGDAPKEEYEEMLRVCKPNGLIILCPGNSDQDDERHEFLVQKGFSWGRFEEPGDGMKRKYWKTVTG
ncbi:MAG TPA: class I SAM-dependent methyltransferase [Thermotogota bacterium]|nr:class I SAM-dependent methyltransferase [Thermotogota bacterium]